MARSNAGNWQRPVWQFDGDYDACDSHDNLDWHASPVRHGEDRYEYDIDLDRKSDGVDFELDMERDGRWLDIDVEIGKLDIDLKVDARKLQADTTPTVSMVGGDAAAIGSDTIVDADIFSRLIDFGDVTIAFGTAKFASLAVSDADPAFAAATTFADVSGADLVFVFSKTTSILSGSDTTFAGETATTTYIAIDFEAFDFGQGQITYNFYGASAYLDGFGRSGGSGTPNIDGNVSMLDVDAQALGENTLVEVLSSILTIADQLSSVSAVTVSAVG
jgi:hypothetical protein